MKFKKMGTRMMAFIIPIIVLAMATLMIISERTSRGIINEQIQNRMNSELLAQNTMIQKYMDGISNSANDLAKMIASTYKTVDLDSYTQLMTQTTKADDLIYGCGVWFEPNAYKDDQRYMSKYVYKQGSNVKETDEYNSEDYNYFTKTFYINAKSSVVAKITEPYYDKTKNKMMSSFAAPIYNKNNEFIGCITVDIDLTKIQNLISSIRVGNGGNAMLVSSTGVYVGNQDSEKVKNGVQITEDDNASLVKASENIMANDSGKGSYKDGSKDYNLYYSVIGKLGWKLIIRIPQSELNAPILQLTMKLIIVCIVALALAVLAVVWQGKYISKKVHKVATFADSLSTGDFTVNKLKQDSKDELGNMSLSLNQMYENNKDVIANITDKAARISSSSVQLSDAASTLLERFQNIESYMDKVNGDMMSSSAATEEVNASAEEVTASVNMLAEKTQDSMDVSSKIKERANEVSKNSQDSFENATKLSKQYETNLGVCIENSKVVENIGQMAGIISEIADQINLLSLNASIEAARAGDQGRGFAVVATEIGKLANQTAEAVNEIQRTVGDVQEAFNGLTKQSKELITFLKDTVTPDYNSFVTVAQQYGQDAVTIENTSESISEMAENIRAIMAEVSDAIKNIAETSQDTSDSSGKILQQVSEVSKVVDEISVMSQDHSRISENLNAIVNRFKVDSTTQYQVEQMDSELEAAPTMEAEIESDTEFVSDVDHKSDEELDTDAELSDKVSDDDFDDNVDLDSAQNYDDAIDVVTAEEEQCDAEVQSDVEDHNYVVD